MPSFLKPSRWRSVHDNCGGLVAFLKVKVKFISVLAALALVSAAGCSKSAPQKTTPTVPVLTATALVTNVPVLIDPPPVGHVTPISTVTIRSQIGGTIEKINFKEGQEVKAGDLLFSIDSRLVAATLAHDKAQLVNAQIQLDREQKLLDQKLISQDEFDTNKSVHDALAATVQSDELNLSYCEIHAPIDGRTGALQFHEGDVVKAPDDVLVTINQIHPIYVEFSVAEKFLPEIQREMAAHSLSVTANFENMEGQPPRGELTFVDNTVDEATGSIMLRATFPNVRGILWPGQFVKLALQLSELTNAVVVPTQAVQDGQNGQMIYVIKPDMKAEARPVKTGLTHGIFMVISSGIQAGETVVTDGQLRLAPGVMVSDKAATNAP